MTQVLFVCMANRYRSVVAEACFRDEVEKRKRGDDWESFSAGTWASDGAPAMKDAIQRAKQYGLDIREHRSRLITNDMLESADLVLVMESGQKEALQVEFPFQREKILLLSEATEGELYDIPDPAVNPLHADLILSQICGLIQKNFDKICDLAQP
jgi:protein-tyrosine phosphatase